MTSSPILNQCMQEPSKVTETIPIPDGLVGEPCESEAWLDGTPCHCIIDTGSQVTIISQSFYFCYLSHRTLFSIQSALDIEGAAGQRVPYEGYVEVDIQFPKDACGTDRRFSILALVSPDQSYSNKYPLLVGTNTLRLMMRECIKWGGTKFLEVLPIQANWVMAYAEFRKLTDSETKHSKVLRVTLGGKRPICLK